MSFSIYYTQPERQTDQSRERGMEAEKMTGMDSANKDDKDDDEDVALPGFRFHPTDEELVGFYLRRKVEKKPLRIDLIKQVDIYKYDPWDLPKASNVGDKEWYFFCKRGRKYRNSIRPNRVTGSGFWKATGIDRPIYSAIGEGRGDCIGLKKSLVYYRGSAGRGTKTDWMMHEFRLPADHDDKSTKHVDVKSIPPQEAEVWTLCRILKRNASHRKCMPDWRELSAKRNNLSVHAGSKTCNVEYSDSHESYISFTAPQHDDDHHHQKKKKQFVNSNNVVDEPTYQMLVGQFGSISDHQADPSTASSNSTLLVSPYDHKNDQCVKYGDDWDELRSVVEFATNPFLM